jgi:hypothetical protein
LERYAALSEENFTSRLIDARTIYEGTHGMTMNELVAVTGIARRMLVAQSRADGWKKQVKEGQTEDAAAAIERFKEWNKSVDRLTEAKEIAATGDEAAKQLARPMIEAALHELIERHKREWGAMRALASEAVAVRNSDPVKAMERARLGKLLSEQMDIIQKGERRAWGLENGEDPSRPGIVVIERE